MWRTKEELKDRRHEGSFKKRYNHASNPPVSVQVEGPDHAVPSHRTKASPVQHFGGIKEPPATFKGSLRNHRNT